MNRWYFLWQYRYVFLVTFGGVFVFSFASLYLIGLLPEELAGPNDVSLVTIVNAKAGTSNDEVVVINDYVPPPPTIQQRGEQPRRIVIEKIGVDSAIVSPGTTNVAALDETLKRGVVHYPGSGLLGDGNVFLFGHSSTLPVIYNKAYKALNHIDYLKAGDVVHVYSATTLYTYTVTTVEKKNESQAVINLADKENKITISTCDSFSGIKQQRIIVEATLTSQKSL